jgi:hypothetical protein
VLFFVKTKSYLHYSLSDQVYVFTPDETRIHNGELASSNP